MEQSININWHIQDQNNNVKKPHREPLKVAVMERITAMMKEGYREGELIETVRMDDSDGEDGIEYHGWWTLKKDTQHEEYLQCKKK